MSVPRKFPLLVYIKRPKENPLMEEYFLSAEQRRHEFPFDPYLIKLRKHLCCVK